MEESCGRHCGTVGTISCWKQIHPHDYGFLNTLPWSSNIEEDRQMHCARPFRDSEYQVNSSLIEDPTFCQRWLLPYSTCWRWSTSRHHPIIRNRMACLRGFTAHLRPWYARRVQNPGLGTSGSPINCLRSEKRLTLQLAFPHLSYCLGGMWEVLWQ